MKRLYTTFIPSKNIFKIPALLLALMALSVRLNAQTYCTSAATSINDDEIFNVTFGSLNNSSTCGALAPGAGSVPYEYSNYTTLPATNYVMGLNYPLSLTIGMCNGNPYTGRARVWIDYNHNGVFTDPGETIYTSPATLFAVVGTVVSATGGITIPATATPGLTRMRVIETESSTAPGSCANPTWGETEDYMVNIVPAVPFDLGVTALIKPVNLKKCFGNDTIVARVVNNGTVTVNFSATPAVVTVRSTGVITNTYTLALNSGTIASYGTNDYTITTGYNMSVAGNYNLKAYTTAAADTYAADDTVSVVVQRKPFFNVSVTPNDTVCLFVPVQTKTVLDPMYRVGAGTLQNTATTYPAPYGNNSHGAKHQFLILASELTAAGLAAGNITAVSFNALNLNNSGGLANFNMGMATTTISALTSFQPGITNVLSASSYTPVLGINTHTLSAPFNWNGTSNIIVETCFNNYPNPNTSSNNVSFASTNVGFSASVWYNANFLATVCSNTATTSGTSQRRPNIYFDQAIPVTYNWSPAIGLSSSTIASPIIRAPVSTNYTLTTNIAGSCSSNSQLHIEILPTPVPNLGSDTLVCSMPLLLNSHTTASSYLWTGNSTSSSLTVNAAGKYWVRATGSNGCVGTDTVKVTLGTLPVVTLGPDSGYCQGSFITLYAGNPGCSYMWSTGATTSSINVSSTGTYSVLVTHPSTCKYSDAINITSLPLPTVGLVFNTPEIFCPTDNVGRPLTEGTPAGGTYIGAGVAGNTFNAAAAGQGTYIILYSVTGTNGCSNAARDTLKVYACVGIDEQESNLGLNIYPNPNNGSFTIELAANTAIEGKVTILTVDGRVVFNEPVSGNGIITKQVNIADLANGIYYLKLETKDVVKAYKIIKQ